MLYLEDRFCRDYHVTYLRWYLIFTFLHLSRPAPPEYTTLHACINKADDDILSNLFNV